MAKKKQPANPKATGNGATISKVDAMQAALQELGLDAKNKDLEGHIRKKFGPRAVPSNFSVTKSAVMKKLRERAAAPQPVVPPPATPAPPSPLRPVIATAGGISLEDLRHIKELAGRYGKDQVKGVLDLLA
jgi:hypothetical protein